MDVVVARVVVVVAGADVVVVIAMVVVVGSPVSVPQPDTSSIKATNPER